MSGDRATDRASMLRTNDAACRPSSGSAARRCRPGRASGPVTGSSQPDPFPTYLAHEAPPSCSGPALLRRDRAIHASRCVAPPGAMPHRRPRGSMREADDRGIHSSWSTATRSVRSSPNVPRQANKRPPRLVIGRQQSARKPDPNRLVDPHSSGSGIGHRSRHHGALTHRGPRGYPTRAVSRARHVPARHGDGG